MTARERKAREALGPDLKPGYSRRVLGSLITRDDRDPDVYVSQAGLKVTCRGSLDEVVAHISGRGIR